MFLTFPFNKFFLFLTFDIRVASHRLELREEAILSQFDDDPFATRSTAGSHHPFFSDLVPHLAREETIIFGNVHFELL